MLPDRGTILVTDKGPLSHFIDTTSIKALSPNSPKSIKIYKQSKLKIYRLVV